MRKRILTLFMAAVMTLSLSACSQSSSQTSNTSAGESSGAASSSESSTTSQTNGEKITLKFFNGNVEMVDWYNDAVDRFNAENDHIKVEHEFLKEGTSALQIKFASGDIPDITTMGTQQMIDAGKFLDLTEGVWWDRIDTSIKEVSADVKSGKNYYIPSNTMITAAIYNQTIFKELGLTPADTWEKFVDNLRAIKAAKPDVTPLYFAGKEAWTMGMLFGYIPDAVQRQKLGELTYSKAALNGDLEQLKFAVAGGPLEKYIDGLLTLQKEGLINDNILTATYDDQINAIANGEAAIIFQGMFAVPGILSANPNAENDLRVMAFPAMEDDVKPAINQGPDSIYFITADSKHPEECKEFLTWLFSAENQKLYTEARIAPSAFNDVTADLGPIYDSAIEVAKNAAIIGLSREPAGFGGDATGIMLQELFAGKYTPAEFAQAFETNWKAAFDAQ